MKFFDGHNDSLSSLYKGVRGENVGFFDHATLGHLDYPRAVEAGFVGGFFAIYSSGDFDLEAHYTPSEQGYTFPLSPALNPSEAMKDTLAMAALLFKIEAESKGRFKVVKSYGELEACLDKGIMAAIFHIEGAAAIGPDLDALEVFYHAGLRSLGPVWSRPNRFGVGVPFSFPGHPDTGDGLNQAGRDLLRACNRLGIMIDVSHMTAKAFWDVAAISEAPIVASHSNAHALCPAPRNLTDDQLQAVKDSYGMVGLNFAVGFLREDGQRIEKTPLATLLRHVDYMVDKLGIDRVGFGSDFDGAVISEEIKDVTGLPGLITALKDHGYDEVSLEKLCYKNWLRVLKATWK